MNKHLKEKLCSALPELREEAARAGLSRVSVLIQHADNAADNGPWTFNEATGEWERPTVDGTAVKVLP